MLTCISMHIGHFAYRKLQFGISAAPLIFQEIIDKVLCDIPYAAAYQDDIIIGATTEMEHDTTLQLVQRRLELHGFKPNPRKSQIKRTKVSFLGFLLKNGALFPCKDCLQAFDAMPYPANKDQLRSAMCTLRHYGVFCKGFSQIGRCLYNLLKQNMRWNWMPAHASAFDRLRRTIAQGKLLCYDIRKPLFITADASKDGLGFVLSHDEEQREIVWLGSRVLSLAEANYSIIERKALAVVEFCPQVHCWPFRYNHLRSSSVAVHFRSR